MLRLSFLDNTIRPKLLIYILFGVRIVTPRTTAAAAGATALSTTFTISSFGGISISSLVNIYGHRKLQSKRFITSKAKYRMTEINLKVTKVIGKGSIQYLINNLESLTDAILHRGQGT